MYLDEAIAQSGMFLPQRPSLFILSSTPTNKHPHMEGVY